MAITKNIPCYCSPAKEKTPYHFSTASLNKIINIWNSFAQDKIFVPQKATSQLMWEKLDKTLKGYVGGPNKYWLWCGAIEKLAERHYKKYHPKLQKLKRDLKLICRKELKPEKPEIWCKNPRTWLSNWDIQNVMTQYAANPKYKYIFLGVYPIDFALMSSNGTCMYSNLCTVDVTKLMKKGKRFMGLITNLDTHDQSGSHWTSTFMVLDPKLQTYGAFYYDSTGSTIPEYLHMFIKTVKDQCDKLNPKYKFKIFQNRKQHQHKNTECGMFSMVYQIRWINKHIVKRNQTSFQEIIANPYIDDEHMLMIRDHLFRPNTKNELKNI